MRPKQNYYYHYSLSALLYHKKKKKKFFYFALYLSVLFYLTLDTLIASSSSSWHKQTHKHTHKSKHNFFDHIGTLPIRLATQTTISLLDLE